VCDIETSRVRRPWRSLAATPREEEEQEEEEEKDYPRANEDGAQSGPLDLRVQHL